jgi:hypothetical protein
MLTDPANRLIVHSKVSTLLEMYVFTTVIKCNCDHTRGEGFIYSFYRHDRLYCEAFFHFLLKRCRCTVFKVNVSVPTTIRICCGNKACEDSCVLFFVNKK